MNTIIIDIEQVKKEWTGWTLEKKKKSEKVKKEEENHMKIDLRILFFNFFFFFFDFWYVFYEWKLNTYGSVYLAVTIVKNKKKVFKVIRSKFDARVRVGG